MTEESAAPTTTETREDASAGVYSAAALVNLISGIGSANDSGQAARPNLQRALLSEGEVEALARDGIYGRLCGLMPDYATQRGWTVSDGTADKDPLGVRMEELEIGAKIAEADTNARAHGRAALFVVVEDAAPSLADPLDPATVRRVKAVHALSYRDFHVVRWDTDIESPTCGKPALFQVNPPNTGRSLQIHASRLLLFLGDPLQPYDVANTRLGYPLAFRWWDSIRDLGSVSAGAARAAQELTVGIFKLAQMAAQATGDQAGALGTRLQLLSRGKSVAQAMVLQAGEDYRRETIPTTGFEGLSKTARDILQLVTGYPEQLLFGTAPGGLNTDGDSWWRNWTNTVQAYQVRRYSGPLRRLIRMLYAEQGGEPEGGWRLTFEPLGALDEKSKAEIRALVVGADSTEIQNGVLQPEEVRGRYATGTYATELQPVGQGAEGPDPLMGRAEQALQALLAGAKLGGQPQQGGAPAAQPEAVAGQESASTDRADGDMALCILAPLDTAGRELHAGALEQVRAVAPDIAAEGKPHITLLFLGEQPNPALTLEAYDGARRVLSAAAPVTLQGGRVRVFDAAPGMPSPIVVEYRSNALAQVAAELMRACAPAVTAAQHDRFRAHTTLGYARLTDEQVGALEALSVPGRHVVREAVLTHGGRTVGRPLPLGG